MPTEDAGPPTAPAEPAAPVALRLLLAAAWIGAVMGLWLNLDDVAHWLLGVTGGSYPVLVLLGWMPLGGLLVYLSLTVAWQDRGPSRRLLRSVWRAVGYLWTITAVGVLPGRFSSTRGRVASDLAAGGPALVTGYDASILALLATVLLLVFTGSLTERLLPRARPWTVLAATIATAAIVALFAALVV